MQLSLAQSWSVQRLQRWRPDASDRQPEPANPTRTGAPYEQARAYEGLGHACEAAGYRGQEREHWRQCPCGKGRTIGRHARPGDFLGCTAWRRDRTGCNCAWKADSTRLSWRYAMRLK